MADIVYMSRKAWTALLDAIRAKSGKSEMLTADEAKVAVENIAAAQYLTDASRLFEHNARASEYKQAIALFPNPTDISYMFYQAGRWDLSDSLENGGLLAKVNMSGIKYATSAFAETNTYLSETIAHALSANYESLLTADHMFASSNAMPETISMTAPNLSNAPYMFAGSTFPSTVDFSGSDFSSAITANNAFDYAKIQKIVLPENFLKTCTSAKGLFYRCKGLHTNDAGGVFRLPAGFMSAPSDKRISVSEMFSATDIKVIDINSDFVAYVESTPSVNTYRMMFSSNLQATIIRCSTVLPANDLFQYGLTPKIFVRRSLVDTYKAATNWSTYADNIFALEDYTADGTVDGEFNYSAAGITI